MKKLNVIVCCLAFMVALGVQSAGYSDAYVKYSGDYQN